MRRLLRATVVMAAVAALAGGCRASPRADRGHSAPPGATATTATDGASTTASGPSPPTTGAGAGTPTVTIAGWTAAGAGRHLLLR